LWFTKGKEFEDQVKSGFEGIGVKWVETGNEEVDLERFKVLFTSWLGMKKMVGRLESNNTCGILLEFR
jgi:hypothetical protein